MQIWHKCGLFGLRYSLISAQTIGSNFPFEELKFHSFEQPGRREAGRVCACVRARVRACALGRTGRQRALRLVNTNKKTSQHKSPAPLQNPMYHLATRTDSLAHKLNGPRTETQKHNRAVPQTRTRTKNKEYLRHWSQTIKLNNAVRNTRHFPDFPYGRACGSDPTQQPNPLRLHHASHSIID